MTHRQRPNIILIVLDTQRVDKLSCYGYSHPTSPCLDDFAAQATLFEQAIAPAQWTIPSHVSMFTGQYPLYHQTVQSDRSIPTVLPTVTEILRQNSYHAFAFCNNPLVGVLNTGIQRGFEAFFNYASFMPDIVPSPKVPPNLLATSFERARRGLAHMVRDIERQFGKSERLLALSQESFFVPFWSRLGNFKGDVRRSMIDLSRYVRAYYSDPEEEPFFIFANLMETHLPYWPAKPFVRKYASWVGRDKHARRFMSRFNTQAYRWATPMVKPLSELEMAALNAMYDAEVAFQDRQLGRLFETLDELDAWDDTMVIVVSDHGEGFGEHNYMGHAFGLYQEVVHVPLVVHFPRSELAGLRVSEPVSTRLIFHTILEAAGIPFDERLGSARDLSLLSTASRRQRPSDIVVSEAYSPANFVSVIERRDPQILIPYQCLSLWRAVYSQGEKLIAVDDQPDKFFNLKRDPGERDNLIHSADRVPELSGRLSAFLHSYELAGLDPGGPTSYRKAEEEEVRDRLRALGYME
jgi:arylsulfatase A-like enzyme